MSESKAYYEIVTRSGGGVQGITGRFETREEAEKVASKMREERRTGTLIRPLLGPLADLTDEECVMSSPVYSSVEVRRSDYYW